MKRLSLLLLLLGSSFADNAPLNKYKLMLNQDIEVQTLKKQVFDTILEDIKQSQLNKVKEVNALGEKEVMEHYGLMAPEGTISNTKAPVDPSLVRGKILKAMQARHKELAKEIYNKIQKSSVSELKNSLAKTVELDAKLRTEANEQYEEVSNGSDRAGLPAAPYYRPGYSNYYNYYGYNYFYNYNYASYSSYPYYKNPYYYTPTYSNGYYYYNPYNYNYSAYNSYYYPRYNRTNNLIATGVFGLATVAAFIDWLKY